LERANAKPDLLVKPPVVIAQNFALHQTGTQRKTAVRRRHLREELWRRAGHHARYCVQRIELDLLARSGQQHLQPLQRMRSEKRRGLWAAMNRHEHHAHGIIAGVEPPGWRSEARIEGSLIGGMSCH
jgi:hypothetical protein